MTNLQSKREYLCALLFLPVYIIGIPAIFSSLYYRGVMSEIDANYACYAVGLVYVMVTCWGFLKEGYHSFTEKLLENILIVIAGYLVLNMLNIFVQMLMQQALANLDNLNNDAIEALAETDTGKTTALAVLIAPIVEEVLFRGGVFGPLAKEHRIIAYTVSIILFSLYHVWSYALLDPSYLWYILMYLPSGFMLCLVYDWTDSIWGSIFMHMMVNAVAMSAVGAL